MITRNNYEEYFLLLADNELSAVEAATVKQFAAQHPDLAEELDILMSCRLDDTLIPVFPKEKLLRPVMWDAENTEPVQTQMLLLLDGELPMTEKQQLEAQIATSTALQADWATLQQTKLAADAIAHPDKESLQHNERKVRPLLWVRWAAAAAVVAGLGWLFQLQQPLEQPVTSDTYAATIPQQKPNTTNATAPVGVPQQTTVADTYMGVQKPNNIPTTQLTATPIQQADNRTSKHPKQLAVSNKKSAAPTTVIENTPVESEPVIARLASTDLNVNTSNSSAAPSLQVVHLSPKAIALPMLAANEKTESFTGSKNDLTVAEDDYVTIGGAHVNKQKMRGLFRNVTRTVARSFTKSKMEPDTYATR